MPFPLATKQGKKQQEEAPQETKATGFKFSTVRAERIESNCYVVTEYSFEFDGKSAQLVSSKVICDKKSRVEALGAVRTFWSNYVGRSMDKGCGFD